MKIRVWTKQPNHFIRETSKTQVDELLNGQFDGGLVIFDDLACQCETDEKIRRTI